MVVSQKIPALQFKLNLYPLHATLSHTSSASSSQDAPTDGPLFYCRQRVGPHASMTGRGKRSVRLTGTADQNRVANHHADRADSVRQRQTRAGDRKCLELPAGKNKCLA